MADIRSRNKNHSFVDEAEIFIPLYACNNKETYKNAKIGQAYLLSYKKLCQSSTKNADKS